MGDQMWWWIGLGALAGFLLEFLVDEWRHRRSRSGHPDVSLALANKEMSLLQAQVDELRPYRDQYESALDQHRAELDSLKARISELESVDASESTPGRTDIEGDKVDAHDLVATQRQAEQLESLQEASEAKDRRIEELLAKVALLEGARVEEQTHQIQVENERILELGRELGAARQEIEELRARQDASAQQDDVARLQAELAAKSKEVEVLMELRSSGADQAREILEWKAKAAALERDVESIKAIADSKDRAVAESLETARRLEGELMQLKCERDVRQREREAHSVKLSDSEDPLLSPIGEAGPETPMASYGAVHTAQSPVSVVDSITNDRDQLVEIPGIGHLYERKLWDAGIMKFEDLADCTADDVYEVIQPAEWQRIEPERWIEEAKRLAEAKQQ